MILIFPPLAKSCEPPAGVAILAGALKAAGYGCTVIDANIEGLMWRARRGNTPGDSWTRRAVSHFDDYVSDLKTPRLYENRDRYGQRVMDVNRVLSVRASSRFRLSLSDYTDRKLSPVKSGDLLSSARDFQENPFLDYFTEKLAPVIQANDTPFIGISVCYLSQALTAFALAGWIRATFPGKKIVMGGGLITSWMNAPTWNNPFESLVHTMVRGRGEDAVVTLMAASMGNKTPSVLSATGVEVSACKPPAGQKNVLPAATVTDYSPPLRAVPDFDFCRWEDYLAPGRIIPYRTATGCYWRKCRFCPEKVEGAKYEPRKNSALLADLHYLQETIQPAHVHFLDDAVSPSFLKCLARTPMRFTWYGFVRFTKDLADPEFCRALYRSGCRMLKLGLESGDQEVLDRMNKGTDLILAARVLAALKQAGIATYVYLLFGTAFEDASAAERTLSYVATHSREITFLNLAVFNLPRFSREVAELETRPFYGGDLSLYLSFKHPRGWHRREVRRFLDRDFKKHPAIAPILRRDPPFFTSNHAMFFSMQRL